ncbi:unnamed protein product [Urochloa humidicola]
MVRSEGDREERDGDDSPRLPPLAAAAVAASRAATSTSTPPRSPPPSSSTPLNPLAAPFDEGPSTGTPDWLRYSASPASSSSDGRDEAPWSPVGFTRRKGKEVVVDTTPEPRPEEPGRRAAGFMADARRAFGMPPRDAAQSQAFRRQVASVVVPVAVPDGVRNVVPEDGWEEVRRRQRRRRDARPARPTPRPVPADLVGKCFNCLESGHVAAACMNEPRCFRCRREGHHSRFCKRGRSPQVGHRRATELGRLHAGFPTRTQPLPRAHPAPQARSASSDATMSAASQSTGRLGTPPAVCAPSSPDVSMPSPAPSPRPMGHPSCRPSKEIVVVPRTQEIDEAETRLATRALVLMIGGARQTVSVTQVGRVMEEYYTLLPEDFFIFRHDPEDYLVEFASADTAHRVLHTHLPAEAPLQLVWKRWRRQSKATFTPLRFRVLVELKGIPAHARNLNTAQRVLGSACSGLVEAPPALVGNDKRLLFVAA